MENFDSILQAIGAILALLLGGYGVFKAQKSVRDEKEALEAMRGITKTAHEVIEVEAEEDHQEVSAALEKKDPAAAIADLFNDRAEK